MDASRRDFGGVDVGGSKTIFVTVTNSGDAPLSITEITTSDERVSDSLRQFSSRDYTERRHTQNTRLFVVRRQRTACRKFENFP